MIRRDICLPNGEPGWALISQPEHARLSGLIAEHVVGLPFEGDDREQFIAAVYHHDDGWANLMDRPKLDALGQPISFMEMELADSLAIWSASIDFAEEFGPLAAWIVAEHFSYLLRGFSPDVLKEPRLQESDVRARTWLVQTAGRCGEWIREWGGSLRTAEQALAWVQVLDAASLWLCCTCPARGMSFMATPPLEIEREKVTFTCHAVAAGSVDVLRPNLGGLPINLTVRGRQVAAQRYRHPQALIAASSMCELRWHIF